MNTIKVNGFEYKTKTVIMDELEYTVGTESLLSVINDLLDSDIDSDVNFASNIDNQIYYYVPDDKINLPTDELVSFLKAEVV